MAVDAFGFPTEFKITGGEIHYIKVAPELVAKLPGEGITIVDRGYDSEDIRDQIRVAGGTPVIPRKKNSKVGNDDIDWCLSKYRHLV